jgi:hypothetical protein
MELHALAWTQTRLAMHLSVDSQTSLSQPILEMDLEALGQEESGFQLTVKA